MRRALVPLAAIWAFGLFGACTSFAPSSDVASNDAGVGVDEGGLLGEASTPSSDGAQEAACPALHGPSMVKVTGFCIDSTEVTVGQYAAFLEAMAALPGGGLGAQPAVCASNTTFRPPYWWRATPDEADAGRTEAEVDEMPVAVVDWCDARAFCAWAGKRLCGRVGGGALTPAEATTTASEWFVACSRNNARAYPYGDRFEADACNGTGSDRRQPVRSNPKCVGGYGGLFDMIGNVEEWVDACDPDSGVCPMTGGTFSFPEGSLHCGAPDNQPRMAAFPRGGFRCCATASP